MKVAEPWVPLGTRYYSMYETSHVEARNFDAQLRPEIRRLWLKFYPDYHNNAFEQYIASLVKPDMKVLEIGAGSGTGLQHVFPLKGRCALYVGIDPDPRVLDNRYLDCAEVTDAARLPYKDGTFDLVFHRMDAEHLEAPRAGLTETARVMRTG